MLLEDTVLPATVCWPTARASPTIFPARRCAKPAARCAARSCARRSMPCDDTDGVRPALQRLRAQLHHRSVAAPGPQPIRRSSSPIRARPSTTTTSASSTRWPAARWRTRARLRPTRRMRPIQGSPTRSRWRSIRLETCCNPRRSATGADTLIRRSRRPIRPSRPLCCAPTRKTSTPTRCWRTTCYRTPLPAQSSTYELLQAAAVGESGRTYQPLRLRRAARQHPGGGRRGARHCLRRP